MTNIKEQLLQNNFIAWLKRRNITFLKNQAGLVYVAAGKTKRLNNGLVSGIFRPMRLKKGFSDIQIFSSGYAIFVELKQENKNLRPSQKEKFIELKRKGFDLLLILKPSGYEILKKVEKEYKELIHENIPFGQLLAENYELLKEKKIIWEE